MNQYSDSVAFRSLDNNKKNKKNTKEMYEEDVFG